MSALTKPMPPLVLGLFPHHRRNLTTARMLLPEVGFAFHWREELLAAVRADVGAHHGFRILLQFEDVILTPLLHCHLSRKLQVLLGGSQHVRLPLLGLLFPPPQLTLGHDQCPE